jgi:hypothetical protein
MFKKNFFFTYRLEGSDRYTRERTVVGHISRLSCARPAGIEQALLELHLLLLRGLLLRDGVRQSVPQLLLQLAPPGSLDTLEKTKVKAGLNPAKILLSDVQTKL